MCFLSCLGGSAQPNHHHATVHGFLSCLGGSAQAASSVCAAVAFLSCLGGSALEHTKINVLIVKEL
tara:strand:- start:3725 stop:3922 length:198 start_codon:yes stop_codon:yes gene_type:complete